MATQPPVGPGTLITVKVGIEGSNRKFKIPLADLGPHVLPQKLRSLLDIPDNQSVVFERYSDSAASYITLDPANATVFKTLARAAKAKLKLRLRATIHSATETDRGTASAQMDLPPVPTLAFQQMGMPMMHPAAQTSQTTLVNVPGVIPPRANPVPFRGQNIPTTRRSPRLSRNAFFDELANISRQRELSLRPRAPADVQIPLPPPAVSWSVYCNLCEKPMAGEHYHCNTCDDGDFDLCQPCVDRGRHCNGVDHWLIKRTLKDGQVVNSTTEKIATKPTPAPKEIIPQPSILRDIIPQEMPGAYTEDVKYDQDEQIEEATRTCNSCINVLPEYQFVTCFDCEDYDLCVPCHEGNKHGHHPGHSFKAVNERTPMGPMAEFLCASGRNVRHSALCDGCDKPIFGVRHKCLNCPDWDYCSECFKSVKFIHQGHRFVPIYEPIPEPRFIAHRHQNIYCDGPLCKEIKEYISGVRYKCAICDDTDFCANCEASPRNRHNRTHPLIMFKTPVRSVSVTTWGDENKTGEPLRAMGDTRPSINIPVTSSKIQTVAESKPVAPVPPPKLPTKDKIQIKDLLAEPIEEKIKVDEVLTPKPATAFGLPPTPVHLDATYVRDTIKDGSAMTPNQRFTQVWTLKNPGPNAWPAGCGVRYVGGDNMLNIEDNQPSSSAEIAQASESNTIGRVVEVGEEISFRVLMKAAKREGVFISYWRLKAPDGTPFGHRLWCHIKVVPEVAFPPAMLPSVERSEEVGRPAVTNQFLNGLLLNHLTRQKLAEEKAAKADLLKMTMQEMRKGEEDALAERLRALRDMATELQVRSVPNQIQARANAASAGQEAARVAQETFRYYPTELPATVPAAPVVAEEPANEEPQPDASGMIFPKLDKESPESSTHDVGTSTTYQPPEVASPAATNSTMEIFEDAESVELLESSDDEPFLTDEEYDILDASDEEDAA